MTPDEAADLAMGDATEAATRATTETVTLVATNAATWAATWPATDDATDAATNAATWAATQAAPETVTLAATNVATWDATDAATWNATRDAVNAATEAATRDATEAATEAATYRERLPPCVLVRSDLGIAYCIDQATAKTQQRLWDQSLSLAYRIASLRHARVRVGHLRRTVNCKLCGVAVVFFRRGRPRTKCLRCGPRSKKG